MTDRGSIFGLLAYKAIQSGHATNRATAAGVWIPKMCGWKGAIDDTHTSSDMVLKKD